MQSFVCYMEYIPIKFQINPKNRETRVRFNNSSLFRCGPVLSQQSEGWRLLDVTHATVRAAFPRKFSRKRTLAAAALSWYAWREGACGGKTWFPGPKPWAAATAAARRLAAQCFAACRLPLAACRLPLLAAQGACAMSAPLPFVIPLFIASNQPRRTMTAAAWPKVDPGYAASPSSRAHGSTWR